MKRCLRLFRADWSNSSIDSLNNRCLLNSLGNSITNIYCFSLCTNMYYFLLSSVFSASILRVTFRLFVIEVLKQHWRVDHLRAGMPRTLRLPGHCQQVPAFPCRGRRVHGSARTARHGGRVRQRSGSPCAESGSERAGQRGDREGLDDNERSRRRRPRGL